MERILGSTWATNPNQNKLHWPSIFSISTVVFKLKKVNLHVLVVWGLSLWHRGLRHICSLGTLTTTETLQLFEAVSLPAEEGSKAVDAVWCQHSRHRWFLQARGNIWRAWFQWKFESILELEITKDTVRKNKQNSYRANRQNNQTNIPKIDYCKIKLVPSKKPTQSSGNPAHDGQQRCLFVLPPYWWNPESETSQSILVFPFFAQRITIYL